MAAHSKPSGMLGMLFALLVFLQATTAFHHAGAGHMHPVPRSHEEAEAALLETRAALAKRANNIDIVGAKDGMQYPRLEIRELKKNADQWNLFLLSLERFKNKPMNDRAGYYQIAGVHGRPFITWNNYGDLKHTAGFCPHGQTLFGSWHRPYLAVYEQAVYQNAIEVIAEFPANQQQRWQNALKGLRIPYWDWAMDLPSGEPNVPTSIRDQTVSVTKPQGQVSIKNPLYSYSWGTSLPSEMGWGPSNGYPETLRRPVSDPPQSNNNEMNTVFGQARVGWRQRVFALFASKKPWGSASTSALGVQTSNRNSDSFESIHDEIHGNAGGNGGHMSYLDVAAFDPLFWLHHANIDRLLAMYQLIVPTTYVANGNINRDMAQWNNGDAVDANTLLQPFTKNVNGDVYSSNDIRETRVLGYFYPETSQRSYNQVAAAVNKLYGQGETPISKRGGNDSTPYSGRPFKEGDYDTVVSVAGDKYAMPGSYSVHCFLGPKSTNGTNSTAPFTNSTSPSTSPNSPYGAGYVGSHTFLGGSVANGNSSSPIMTEGSIPLTAALMEKEANGEIKSLHPDDVEPYLKDHLSYKVIGPDGREFKPEEVPNFHVKVKSCEVKPASGDELPTFEDYVELPKVNLPASKPWTYTPSPSQSSPSSPSGSVSYPTGTMPGYGFGEGYCVMEQVINYVDPAGKFLYSTKI